MTTPVNVWDYEALAAERLDAGAHGYYAGGAGDEVTLRRNVAAFGDWLLRPRVLVDVETCDLRTTVLGQETAMPLLVKGVLTAEDAVLACGHGAAGVVVSNHGGRQLDGVSATIDALPEVVEAVGGRLEVLVDGGVRRGTDVVKALALGARAVLAGRAPLWGLSVNGEAGARDVLELLKEEILTALQLVGCASPAEVTRAHVQLRQ